MHDPTIDTLRINGGRLCLDFVNTTTWEKEQPGMDFIGEYADLVTWGVREQLIEKAEAARLRALAMSEQGPAADAALDTARQLRSAFRAIFAAGVAAATPDTVLAVLNRTLFEYAAAIRIERSPAGGLRFTGGGTLDGWLLPPLLVSGLELAASPARGQVRICPGDGCHWLFLDQSRNGTRRWCSMESCGNRAKTRAHYHTHRGSQAASASPIARRS